MSLRAIFVLACLYSKISHASPNHSHSIPQIDHCATPTTYAMITPSPDALPYPVTSQGQQVTSWIPQYAICNPDNSDCTTIYSSTTYNWCSTVLPCYPSSCTVTDCAQTVTFSHANSYNLKSTVCPTAGAYTIHGTSTSIPAPTTVYYVEPVVTKYAVSYRDYAEGKYEDVGVERCVEVYPGKAVCEVYVEHWVEEVRGKDEVVVLPVTVHTYCPEPTRITYGGEVVEVVDVPTTYTFVTEKRETETRWETETKRSSTSTLTSTITIVIPETTAKPDVITPSYSSEIAPKSTEEYTETKTITTDCSSSIKPTTEPTIHLTYHAPSIDSTSTETLTKTITATLHTPEYASIMPAEPSHHSAVVSDYSYYSTPQRREVPNTINDYQTPPKPKHHTYKPHKNGTFAVFDAKQESKHTGEAHNYGEYADGSKEDEQRKAGALITENLVERGEYTTYAYEASGAGKADGQKHSYGQYSDYSEGHEYSNSGAGGGYRTHEPAVVYEDLEERDEYSYEAAGAGKTSGEAHSYGRYADYSKEYEYSEGGEGATYSHTPATASKGVQERDEYSAYEYEADGSGKASGEAHSYGQYADYSEKYEYSNSGAGAGYSTHQPVTHQPVTVEVEERDEFSFEESGSGKASGEVHSYGQYADYSDEYDYSQGESLEEGSAGRSYGSTVEKAKATGDYSREASGERHSYGQYQDYEKEVKHEYENEATRKVNKYGEKGYSYGVEGEGDESSYY